MNRLQAIETLVKDIPCPVCLNSRFNINLSCDLPRSSCDYHAECQHCKYKFLVTQDKHTIDQIWPKIQKHVESQRYPECGDPKLSLDFVCDLKSEDCHFLFKCEDNNHYTRLSKKGMEYLFA